MGKFALFFLFVNISVLAQDFKMGYTPPSNSANPNYRHVVLEIEGVDRTLPAPVPKGMLVPKMTTSERISISVAPSSLLVFDTDNMAFFFNANPSTGTPVWQTLLTGTSNSRDGVYTHTDSILTFNTSSQAVKITTQGIKTLDIGINSNSYIRIPQAMGSGSGQTGMAISDGSSAVNGLLTTTSALVRFNSGNKGILLPRVQDLSNIKLPEFGTLVILTGQSNVASNGLYIQMSATASSPQWEKVTSSVPQ